jgi:hypothetical protein
MQLSIAEDGLYAMYYDSGSPWPDEYSGALQQEFSRTVSMLKDMPSLECLLTKWRCLDARLINPASKLLSVRVDQNHRLECSYDDAHTVLIIRSLSRVAVPA